MLAAALLGYACLDLPHAERSAYAVRLGDRMWACGDNDALTESGDLIWFRVDERTGVIRSREDLDEAVEIFRPVRESGDRLDGLREKRDEYAAEQVLLTEQVRRLVEKRQRYAPASEKNLAITDELGAAETRRKTVAETLARLDREEEALREQNRQALDRAGFRLTLLIERFLSD